MSDARISMLLPAQVPIAPFPSTARADTLLSSTLRLLLLPVPALLVGQTATNVISMGLGTATLDSAKLDMSSRQVLLTVLNALMGALSAIQTT